MCVCVCVCVCVQETESMHVFKCIQVFMCVLVCVCPMKRKFSVQNVKKQHPPFPKRKSHAPVGYSTLVVTKYMYIKMKIPNPINKNKKPATKPETNINQYARPHNPSTKSLYAHNNL